MCMLSGEFEASVTNNDPIVEMVKAAGAKFLPYDANGKSRPVNNEDLSFQVLSDKVDGLWQTERFINLKRDEIVQLRDEQAVVHERATEAEDHVSDTVRYLKWDSEISISFNCSEKI